MFTKMFTLFNNLLGIQYFSESNDQISHCSIVLFVHLTVCFFLVDSAACVKISFEACDTEITDTQ